MPPFISRHRGVCNDYAPNYADIGVDCVLRRLLRLGPLELVKGGRWEFSSAGASTARSPSSRPSEQISKRRRAEAAAPALD